MRPSSAALCAAALVLALASPARAHDRVSDTPQPVSRTVLVPPAAQPAPPVVEPAAVPPPLPGEPGYVQPPGAVAAPTQAPRGPGSELGFQFRVGAVDSDRLLLGSSIAGSSGFLTVGFSADAIMDVEGTSRHYQDNGGGDWWGNWCLERPDGRCFSRLDAALSGFAGLRLRSDPTAGVGLRLDLLGELGWQWTRVNERTTGPGGGAIWEDASRAYTFGGVRANLGITVLRHATFGFGAFARQGLGDKACLGTGGRCTWVGGRMTGVFMFAGGDWGGGG